MKKSLFLVFVVGAICMAIGGCIKNTPYVTTTNPTMTADVGAYKFIASAVTPATIDTQVTDTSTTLVITGYTSDRVNPYDKIVLYINNYKGATRTFSIVQGQANAIYYHGMLTGLATGGVVAITSVSTEVISGYFSFTTADGLSITNGKYTVNLP